MKKQNITTLRDLLTKQAPDVTKAVFDHLSKQLIPDEAFDWILSPTGYSFNDPIWHTINLTPLQSAVVRLPLLQRLRRTRQLGFAYLIYPSANHSRFEHSLGASHAALQMYDHLARESALEGELYNRLRQSIEVAALTHDCGHTVFSHVGEKVLQAQYGADFDAALSVLNQYFQSYQPTSNNTQKLATVKSSRPPAAEIISALLILSERFQRYLVKFNTDFGGIKGTVDQLIEDACALILGKYIYNPTDKHRNSFVFVKNIISGDIDADKIDYVARDAYFAGLPVSADVNRLLAQLTVVPVTPETKLENISISFTASGPTKYYYLGIRPSGTSALEMFVLTRSYLFDRLYTHHKVRSAERMLERLLLQRLAFSIATQQWGINEIFSFLFSIGGDDAVLIDIPRIEKSIAEGKEKFIESFAERVNGFLTRNLPRRALAISSRFQNGHSRESTLKKSAVVVLPWNKLDGDLSTDDGQIEFEKELCQLAELDPFQSVYIDYPIPNPIKENPEIWLVDQMDNSVILRVNKYFNAEQLSNAYQDVKQLIWIFYRGTSENTTKLAAAVQFLLFKKYHVVLSEDAFRRAKIKITDLQPYLIKIKDNLLKNNEIGDAELIDYLTAPIENRPLDIRLEHFEKCLSLGTSGADAKDASISLCKAIKKSGLSVEWTDSYIATLEVLKHLIGYANANWCHNKFRDETTDGRNEYRFHEHLKEYLKCNSEISCIFEVQDGPKTAGGIPDLVLNLKNSSTLKVFIELKSVNKKYKELIETNANQPCVYASSTGQRLSILFCQFGQPESLTLGQTLQVREGGDASSGKHLILCLGVQGFADSPSHRGSGTKETCASST